MFKDYNRAAAKKGALIIIFKIKYMFNDIWPIYNVLKKNSNDTKKVFSDE
jgi:hypothetical protein